VSLTFATKIVCCPKIDAYMKVTFLGTGTSQGVPLIACGCRVCMSTNTKDKRLRTSVLVQVGDVNIVIDSGPDFRQQMLQVGIKHIDGLVFTHAHKDHIAGMDDIRGFNFKMKRAINVYCTEQVETQMRAEFAYIFADTKYPGIPEVNIHTIHKNVKFDIAGIALQPIEVLHYKLPVLGFRINDFVYITDANYISKSEREKIKGCHTLVLNALRKEQHVSHFTLQEALDVVADLKPIHAYFTHLSHQMGLHDEVESELPRGVKLAYDGLTISIPA
jgi:phosphoribosyl 1,2-cyclic phosphate phosphodiesterase